jgi:hypothetical protein
MMSSDPTSDSRVAALEREVRRLSAIATFTGLGLLLLLVLHFYPKGELTGRSLTIHDAQGMRRIELGFREDGSPMLRLNNAGQRARAMMFVAEDGRAVFRLSDTLGTHRAQMFLEPDGRPGVVMAGQDGRTRVALGVGADGAGDLTLRDASGAVQAARSR